MIRIDEIYTNVFVAAFQERHYTSVHWFDPFGSVKIGNLCSAPRVNDVGNRLLFWDQEPVYDDTFWPFIDYFQSTYNGPITVITSEHKNQITQTVCDTYKIEHDYYFFHGWAALDWYRGYNRTFLYQPWIDRDFPYRFMCANNIVGGNRSHRIKFFAEICRRGLTEHNLISFPAICPYENKSVQDISLELGIDMDLGSWLPRVIDHDHGYAGNSHRINFWQPGCQAFCHVVTETVYNSDRLHLTEKTFKPIVMQQPFVLIAPKGSLAYLRSYGFRTFDTIWDESYDHAEDDVRIAKVADLLTEINGWSSTRLRQAQHDINDIVMHNHAWFYGGFEQILWRELTDMIGRW